MRTTSPKRHNGSALCIEAASGTDFEQVQRISTGATHLNEGFLSLPHPYLNISRAMLSSSPTSKYFKSSALESHRLHL